MDHKKAIDILESRMFKVEPLKAPELSFKKAPFFGPQHEPEYSVVCNEQINRTNYSLALLHRA